MSLARMVAISASPRSGCSPTRTAPTRRCGSLAPHQAAARRTGRSGGGARQRCRGSRGDARLRTVRVRGSGRSDPAPSTAGRAGPRATRADCRFRLGWWATAQADLDPSGHRLEPIRCHRERDGVVRRTSRPVPALARPASDHPQMSPPASSSRRRPGSRGSANTSIAGWRVSTRTEAGEMVDDEMVHWPALALLTDDHALESTTPPGLSPSGPAR